MIRWSIVANDGTRREFPACAGMIRRCGCVRGPIAAQEFPACAGMNPAASRGEALRWSKEFPACAGMIRLLNSLLAGAHR